MFVALGAAAVLLVASVVGMKFLVRPLPPPPPAPPATMIRAALRKLTVGEQLNEEEIFDIIGGIAWGAGITLLGYFLGNVPFVKNNLELMILLIVFLSILPGLVTIARNVSTAAPAARRYQPKLPGPPLNGPTIRDVTQPP